MDICKRSVTLFSLLTTAVMFLLHAQTSASAIVNGLQICCKSILPSLFPFFVVTNLWISLGYGEQLSCAAAPIMTRMFHLPGAAASALVLSCCGGYPVGAQTIVSLYGTKQISKNDAEQALLFCNNAGPAFVFGILGGTLFHSILLGAALFLIHLISALLIGFLFRPPSLQDSLMSEKVA